MMTVFEHRADPALPRLPDSIVRRPRLLAWLQRHTNSPLRLVIAPPGSGKSTLLVTYAATATRRVVYVPVDPDAELSFLLTDLSKALGEPLRTLDDLRETIQAAGKIDLIFDDLDRAQPETIRAMLDFTNTAPPNSGIIFSGRSRSKLDAARLCTKGFAILCGGEALAFMREEIRALAELLGVAQTDEDEQSFYEETEGWAAAVSGAIRCAAESGRPLGAAFETWVREYGGLFREYLRNELESADPDDRSALGALIERTPVAIAAVETADMNGLFIRAREEDYAPFRVVAHLLRRRTPPADVPPVTVPLDISLFGRFEASIAGTPIRWIRRRDSRLIAYLALQPDGTATRIQLMEVFWPGTDRLAAAQSLRTVCANIRKALADVIGFDAVPHYFDARGDVRLIFDRCAVDLHRFRDEYQNAERFLEASRLGEARQHFERARSIYRAPLMQAEEAAPWIAEPQRSAARDKETLDMRLRTLSVTAIGKGA